MKIRLAEKNDLPKLETMFTQIVKEMNDNGIKIWNEYYPYEEFDGDIEKRRLYLMVDNDTIVGAFAIFEDIDGSENFQWEDSKSKAMYIGRLGINVDYHRQGLGSKLLSCAKDIASQFNCKYLRLTVVDSNLPAIKLYLKNGYSQVDGSYNEFSESLNKTIREVGYEIKIK